MAEFLVEPQKFRNNQHFIKLGKSFCILEKKKLITFFKQQFRKIIIVFGDFENEKINLVKPSNAKEIKKIGMKTQESGMGKK